MNYFEVVSVRQKHGRTVYPNCKVESPGDHLARDLFVAVCFISCVMSVKSKSETRFLASWVEDGAWGCGGEEQLVGAAYCPFVLVSSSLLPGILALLYLFTLPA